MKRSRTTLLTAALGALIFWLWYDDQGGRAPAAPARAAVGADGEVRPSRAPRAPAGGASASAPLAGEEQVAIASGVVVEAIEQSRPWACAGVSLRLFGRVGGDREPGAIARWIWPGASGVELQPGETLLWRAPSAPGRYPVRFQVVKDLGGRRVGVLAERAHEIEVRACGAPDDAEGPLRLRAERLPGGAFRFEAAYEGGEPPGEYLWYFDDDSPPAKTLEPRAEHAFATAGLGPNETRAFAARVVARSAGGPPLEATAFAVVRGKPAARDVPDVELDVGRFRPAPDGGFQSTIALRVPAGSDVTWQRLERVVRGWGDDVRTVTLPWAEAVHIDERLERGGFRGEVRVGGDDAGPGVKQVHDTLYGRDAAGREIVASWTPFKRAAAPDGRPPAGAALPGGGPPTGAGAASDGGPPTGAGAAAPAP
jgi:hypothetical protein